MVHLWEVIDLKWDPIGVILGRTGESCRVRYCNWLERQEKAARAARIAHHMSLSFLLSGPVPAAVVQATGPNTTIPTGSLSSVPTAAAPAAGSGTMQPLATGFKAINAASTPAIPPEQDEDTETRDEKVARFRSFDSFSTYVKDGKE